MDYLDVVARVKPFVVCRYQRNHPVLNKYISPPIGFGVDMLQTEQFWSSTRLASDHVYQYSQFLFESGHPLQILHYQFGLKLRGLAAVDKNFLHIRLGLYSFQQPYRSIYRLSRPGVL